MKRRSGITFVETMAVTLIIIVISAALIPVFRAVKERSLIQSSCMRLKQLHVAITLYRTDWDSGGYANQYAAGLPPYSYVYASHFGLGKGFFVSPCGYKPSIEGNLNHLSYQYAPSPYESFSKYLSEHLEESLVMNDPHCNPDDIAYNSPFLPKRGLGVVLSGRLINQYKRGSPGSLEWWTPSSP